MQWKAKPIPEKEATENLAKALGVSPILAELLLQRGITSFDEAKSFFRPSIDHLHDPFLMEGMAAAVNRIERAKKNQDRLMIYGDYDVDGTTSVALMYSFLAPHFDQISSYIPDRYTEGYGISTQGIDHAAAKGVKLIIALDCGVKALEKVSYAKSKGIDFIICDHHRPGDALPEAIAVLDPKRSDCSYPYKELCGCGIGFKLIQALTQQWTLPLETLSPYLDLVALAIAADIVPITGENRVLCALGIVQLRNTPRYGLQPFLQQLKKPATVTDLVFVVAPRINAAGRMAHALNAVELLLSPDLGQAGQSAQAIEVFNQERRSTDERITAEALAQIDQTHASDAAATVVYAEDWHKGVIGIVASRLIEKHYRPTVVLTKSGEVYAGSVRSVHGFDVYQALAACKDHMLQFGGHKYAAGLTLKPDQLQGFKTAFEKAVQTKITKDQQSPVIEYDACIGLDEVRPKMYRIINQMAPFGPKNMRPVFRINNCLDAGGTRAVGKDKDHLRLQLQTSSGVLSGIAFGEGSLSSEIQRGTSFDLLCTLDENEWNNTISLQLKVKSIRLHK